MRFLTPSTSFAQLSTHPATSSGVRQAEQQLESSPPPKSPSLLLVFREQDQSATIFSPSSPHSLLSSSSSYTLGFLSPSSSQQPPKHTPTAPPLFLFKSSQASADRAFGEPNRPFGEQFGEISSPSVSS